MTFYSLYDIIYTVKGQTTAFVSSDIKWKRKREGTDKIFSIIFAKPLDKTTKVWYNIYVIRRADNSINKRRKKQGEKMKQYNFVNENGNVAAKVREALKKSIMGAVKEDMQKRGFACSTSADGEVAVYIADNAKDGEPIYAFIGTVVSMRDPAVKTAKSKSKSKKKNTEEAPLPDLFATEGEE